MFRHPPRTAERRRLEDRRPVSVAMQPKALAMEGTRPPVISPLERPTSSRGKCMACPTTITLIRHAEKPPKAGTPYGITPDGHQDVNSLTSVRWQRAGGLVSLFAPVIGPVRYSRLAVPNELFATRIGHESENKREQGRLRHSLPGSESIYAPTI
jgi:hypothetical protein